MTKQEYVELISKKIDEEAFPATNGDLCVYLSKEGKECFIGVLIPKDKPYKTSLLNLYSLCFSFPEVQDFFPEGCSLLTMRCIQQLHDDYFDFSPKEFKECKNVIIGKLKKYLGLGDNNCD